MIPIFQSQEECHAWRRQKMLLMLATAAAKNLPCPTNQEFCDALGYTNHGSASRMFYHLARDRRIVILRQGRRRVVGIVATGAKTQDYCEERMRLLLDTASALWNVPTHKIMGPSRKHEFVAPRFALYQVARETNLRLVEVARFMARDHSTIRYGQKQGMERARRSNIYRERMDKLRAICGQAQVAAA